MTVQYRGSEHDSTIIDHITSRIQDGLSHWYGDSSELLYSEPEIRSYTNSFLLRYGVRTPFGERSVLVKIRRSPKMQALSQSMRESELHANIPDEYRAMQLAYERIGDEHASFTAIRPLTYLEEYFAIVMEEFPSRSLRQLLEKPQTQAEKRNRVSLVKEAAHKAGELVRYFHEHVQTQAECPYATDELTAQAESFTVQLEHYSNGQVKSQSLLHTFEQKLAGKQIQSIPFSGIHQDLTCDNVLYSRNGKVCLIDIKTRPGPIYADLGLLLVHPETFRSQIFRGGFHFSEELLEAYRSALLSGYFAQEPVNAFLVNLFCAIRVLDKWTMHAELLHRYKGMKRAATRPLVPIVNRYFERLLQRYLDAANP